MDDGIFFIYGCLLVTDGFLLLMDDCIFLMYDCLLVETMMMDDVSF